MAGISIEGEGLSGVLLTWVSDHRARILEHSLDGELTDTRTGLAWVPVAGWRSALTWTI